MEQVRTLQMRRYRRVTVVTKQQMEPKCGVARTTRQASHRTLSMPNPAMRDARLAGLMELLVEARAKVNVGEIESLTRRIRHVEEILAEEHRREERRREDKRLAKLEAERQAYDAFLESWDNIPHVARFGLYERGRCFDRQRSPGDRRHSNQWWLLRLKDTRLDKRLRAEHEERTGTVKRGSMGRGRRSPRKQPRGWEQSLPQSWRRRKVCDARWDHLFD